MTPYRLIKTILFPIAGVLFLIFYPFFLKNECAALPYLVGGVMLYYGIEAILTVFLKKEFLKEQLKLTTGALTTLLGMVMIFAPQNALKMTVVCVSWAVWAILREDEEIYEKVVRTWNVLPVAILNLAESVAVIWMSVSLMLTPGEHHAKLHLILLGIELILEVSWEYLYEVALVLRRRRALISPDDGSASVPETTSHSETISETDPAPETVLSDN